MALRLGCDLCQVDQMRKMLEDGGESLERLFAVEERKYVMAQREPEQHLAGIFAAKEALGKAVREPGLLGKYYKDVTVDRRADGAPYLRLSDALANVFARRGIEVLDLSISHDREYAMAAVLVEVGAASEERRPRPRCSRCFLTLDYLIEQRIADVLIPVRGADGAMRYLCPACARGW